MKFKQMVNENHCSKTCSYNKTTTRIKKATLQKNKLGTCYNCEKSRHLIQNYKKRIDTYLGMTYLPT